MNKNHKIVIAVLIVVLFTVAIATFLVRSDNKKDVVPAAIDTFSNAPGEEPYTDLNGNPVSLNEYLGNILVVATWASWSPFSADDLNKLQRLAVDYKDRGIIFLAINRKESREQAGRYLLTLPEIKNVVMVLDPRDHFYVTTGGYAMPELVVYSKNGEIIKHSRGVITEDEIRSFINEILSSN